MSYPLESLRVVDLSRVLAGPYAGRMLAELGADVVKIEPPGGDVTRFWGHKHNDIAGYYLSQNVGKRCVCVDLTKERGPALVRRFAEHADVLIENFRPGIMKQYGLDYPALAELNPRLIMLSISGFGQQGPESQRPAYAGVLHVESGIVQRQAEEQRQHPVDPPVSMADMNAGLHGLVGLLAALVMRERTGRGQHVDMGMLDAMLATDDYIHYALDGLDFTRDGGNEIFDVVGGPLIIAGDMRWIWHQIRNECGVVDPASKTAPRAEKIALRRQAVLDFFASFDDRDELKRALDKANLAWGDLKSSREALGSPTVAARGIVAEVDDGAGDKRRVIRAPYRFSNAQSGVRGAAGRRGQHNREVLQQWLGMSDQDIDALLDAGVVLQQTPAPTR